MSNQNVKTIGITGGIGSGKTIVAKIISCLGYPVFYSDKEAKSIVYTDEGVRQQLIDLLGSQAYHEGQFNRGFVAEKVFRDPTVREKVNAIVHPAVRTQFKRWAEKQDSPLVFNEAAILFETGAYKQLDAVILVTAPSGVKIKRVMKRDNCDKQAVLDRMSAQWTDAQKMEMTNLLILNDDVHPVIAQIEKILDSLLT
jgi:dephospho-CoA kinase